MANGFSLFAHRGLGEEKPEEELMGNIVDALIVWTVACKIFFSLSKKTSK
jgi:hypothetical protein